MKSVGEKLRRERLQRGLDLATVASLTRINQKYLEAIETGTTDRLPSGFFYRSFVRQYATTLGLDVTEIEAELERAREAEAPVLHAALEHASFAPKPTDPIVEEANRRGHGRLGGYLALLVAVVVGCSVFYGWWHRLETGELARSRPDSSEQTQEANRAKPQPSVAEPQKVAQQTAQNTPDSSQESSIGVTLAPVSSTPKVPGISPDDKVVIKIAATEETWVAITADGKTIFSGLLQPAQELVLGGKERAFVRVGNAGGLALSWNGKAIGPVGARGQVRNVLLTPESYQIMAPGGTM